MGFDAKIAAGVADYPPLRGPVNDATLLEIARRIAAARWDSCIVLFGSRARGDHRPDSDIDMLVVTPCEQNPLVIAGELYTVIADRDFDVDLVVMTPEKFGARRSGFDPFLRDVLAEGRVLHGALG